MAKSQSSADQQALTGEDYEEIVEAVMETARGRWFLEQYAIRNRTADTAELLRAIKQLENAMPSEARMDPSTTSKDAAALRSAIHEMAEEITATKREIASIGNEDGNSNNIADATAELDAVVNAAETAANDILEAAEAVQEMAWTLREENVADAYCDALDLRATEIYTACSFQDITGQRTQKVVRLLEMLDQRISTLAKLWTAADSEEKPQTQNTQAEKDDWHLLNGPALGDGGTSQDDVDLMMTDQTAWSEDGTAELAESQDGAAASSEGSAGDLVTGDPEPDSRSPENPGPQDQPGTDQVANTAEPAPATTEAGPQPDGDGSSTKAPSAVTVEGTTDVDFENLSQKDMDALFA